MAAEKNGRVEGKIALITGGAQGLGEASARMLVREGARCDAAARTPRSRSR